MPSKSVRSQLVPRSFHQELIAAMQAAGLTRMYEFTASTDRDPYHVDAEYAQETNHFFYREEHGFLVRLALCEDIDKQGRYRCWWTGRIFTNLDSQAMIEYQVDTCEHWRSGGFMEECEPFEHILGNIKELMCPFRVHNHFHFRDEYDQYAWSIEYDHDNNLSIGQLVTMLEGLLTHFGPFLQPTLGQNFDAWEFTNTFAWPHIEP